QSARESPSPPGSIPRHASATRRSSAGSRLRAIAIAGGRYSALFLIGPECPDRTVRRRELWTERAWGGTVARGAVRRREERRRPACRRCQDERSTAFAISRSSRLTSTCLPTAILIRPARVHSSISALRSSVPAFSEDHMLIAE